MQGYMAKRKEPKHALKHLIFSPPTLLHRAILTVKSCLSPFLLLLRMNVKMPAVDSRKIRMKKKPVMSGGNVAVEVFMGEACERAAKTQISKKLQVFDKFYETTFLGKAKLLLLRESPRGREGFPPQEE